MTVLIIVLGIVGSIGLYCFFDYKKQELEYKKEQDKHISDMTENSLKLEIEKEKTRQLEIKAEYREKYNNSLY